MKKNPLQKYLIHKHSGEGKRQGIYFHLLAHVTQAVPLKIYIDTPTYYTNQK